MKSMVADNLDERRSGGGPLQICRRRRVRMCLRVVSLEQSDVLF